MQTQGVAATGHSYIVYNREIQSWLTGSFCDFHQVSRYVSYRDSSIAIRIVSWGYRIVTPLVSMCVPLWVSLSIYISLSPPLHLSPTPSRTADLSLLHKLSASRSISSSGRRCPDVTAKLMSVLRHSACRCHRTERICDVFLPSLSWLSSASFPGYHSLIIVFSKPLWRVTWPKYYTCVEYKYM